MKKKLDLECIPRFAGNTYACNHTPDFLVFRLALSQWLSTYLERG